MKDVPEIDPEIRGLIEEIVANPRSSLRFVPQRALLPWLEKESPISSRDVSSDTATRHLVAAHREAIALLLREAAHIAYWKAPALSHKPTGADGTQYNPAGDEDAWQIRAMNRIQASFHSDNGVELLRQCITSIDPSRGFELARASQMLVPTLEGALAQAEHLKQVQPRTAFRIYERVTRSARRPLLQGLGWAGVGHVLCHLRKYDGTMNAYQRSSAGWQSAWFCLLNIACLIGDVSRTMEAAAEIERLWSARSTQVEEATKLFSGWARRLTRDEYMSARATVVRLQDRLPEAAARIGQAYA